MPAGRADTQSHLFLEFPSYVALEDVSGAEVQKSMLKRLSLAALACCSMFAPQCATRVMADDLADTALSVAPQDVAFFSTSVNMSDSWDDFVNSRLVTRFRAVPYVKRLEGELLTQWENPQGQVVQAKGVLEMKAVQKALSALKDLVNDEIFVYGDADWCDSIAGFVELKNKISSQMSADPRGIEQYLQENLASDLAGVSIPTTVIGFRLGDPRNAMYQLNLLEGMIRGGGAMVPELGPVLRRLTHTNFDGGMSLSIMLDASLLPVDQMNGDEREIAELIQKATEGRNVAIHVAIKGDLMLLVLGEGEFDVEAVGNSAENLLSHEAISVLKEAAPERLRAVSYSSEQFRTAIWEASYKDYFSRIASQVVGPIQAELEESGERTDWVKDIESDMARMDELLAEGTPNYGAVLGWQVATDSGAEGFAYDWTDSAYLENATPLGIVDNTGARPLLMVALKQAVDQPGALKMLELVLDSAPGHIRNFIKLAERSEEGQAEALRVLDQAWPLVMDTAKIMRDKIGPSLDERQTSFVLSAGWLTDNFGPGGPRFPKPVPLPELGLVCKLKNQDLFLSGCEELYGVVDRVVELIREVNPDFPEDYVVPRPASESIQGGKRFFYSEFADAVPVEGFNPQVAVNQDVVVFGFSQRQVDDMLDTRSTGNHPAWLSPQTPVASTFLLDTAGITSTVRPWIELGFLMNVGTLDAPLGNAPVPVPTGNDVLQMWDCLTSLGKVMGSTTVTDDGTQTRWVWIEQ